MAKVNRKDFHLFRFCAGKIVEHPLLIGIDLSGKYNYLEIQRVRLEFTCTAGRFIHRLPAKTHAASC